MGNLLLTPPLPHTCPSGIAFLPSCVITSYLVILMPGPAWMCTRLRSSLVLSGLPAGTLTVLE